ncbi:uncharacterized protein LOC131156497 [Malania oleifera]|uniref:uncharacterized protein LOC131156497 n=1 Tax=Malania oleifera TaxID=397392 RepID=UPI0025AE44A2|nr:uncharacterized protein LOC131156497 [Malania oleifera]
MDSFTIRNVKAEKANAILRYRRLQKLATLCRFIELCVFLIMVSRISSQLPVSVKLFGDYFRDLFVALLSPRFVFVVGNAIIIILFSKSGQFSTQDPAGNSIETGIIEKIMDSSEKGLRIGKDEAKYRAKQGTGIEKRVSTEVHTCSAETKKNYRRNRSENLVLDHCKKSLHVLKRSETEKYQKSSDFGVKQVERSYSEDNMSNEEFRRTVEDFIARQQRLLREEES